MLDFNGVIAMSFDGLTLAASVHECSSLVRARIAKVHHLPAERSIVLTCRVAGGSKYLVLSAHQRHARFHLTLHRPRPEQEPTALCMLLRKLLGNGVVLDVDQVDLDRVSRVTMSVYDEMGRARQYRLLAEIMGPRSNVLLVDEDDRIVDALVRSSPAQNPYRTVMPGHPYRYPPRKEKLDPRSCTREAFLQRWRSSDSSLLTRWLIRHVEGLGPVSAGQIAGLAGLDGGAARPDDESAAERCWRSLLYVRGLMLNREWVPWASLDVGAKGSHQYPEFGVIPPEDTSSESIRLFSSIGEMLDAVTQTYFLSRRIERERTVLEASLSRALERAERRRRLQKMDMAETEDYDELQTAGELLTAYLHRVEPKSSRITLPDYHEQGEPERVIELDPALSPAENAQRYFRRYHKARRKRAESSRRMEETEKEMEYLLGLRSFLAAAEDEEALAGLREEMARAGYLEDTAKTHPQRSDATPRKGLRIQAPSGHVFRVGRSNLENEHLTLREAAAGDLWFHVKDAPGAHVLLEWNETAGSPSSVLEEGAIIAAYYSKFRQSSNVPVDYTAVRHVRKPRGARPGTVIYEHHHTVYVTPPAHLADLGFVAVDR